MIALINVLLGQKTLMNVLEVGALRYLVELRLAKVPDDSWVALQV